MSKYKVKYTYVNDGATSSGSVEFRSKNKYSLDDRTGIHAEIVTAHAKAGNGYLEPGNILTVNKIN